MPRGSSLRRKEKLGLVAVNADSAALFGALKLHLARNQGEQRVVVTATHVGARVELGSALTNDDAACLDNFTGILLDSQALGIRISTVTG